MASAKLASSKNKKQSQTSLKPVAAKKAQSKSKLSAVGRNAGNPKKTADSKKAVIHNAKSDSHDSGLFIHAGKDIWPMEKDVLFRPDRFKYVRKLIHPDGCVFCTAAKAQAEFDTLCVYKTVHSMIVLNKFPYNSGHLLVIPRKHLGNPLELSDIEYQDLHEVLRQAIKALKQVYQPGGMNLGLNLGAVAGAGIPEHMHYHVIPRWAGDLNFFPLVAETKTVIESLEMTFDRLVAYFKNID